jgi:CRP/FNR family transcriptional regulator
MVLPPFKEADLKIEMAQVATFQKIPKGETLIRQGQYLKVLPIVVSGAIRVFQTFEDREILLYYVRAHETCIMSLTACLFNSESASYAITDSPTEVLYIPSKYITEWQARFPSWNQFILNAYKNRYDELLHEFTDAVFKKMDARVLDYLRNYRDTHSVHTIPISHQALALELGTTRVVISRILKNFELEGLIGLHRGSITLKRPF